jgi:hypothetical protein
VVELVRSLVVRAEGSVVALLPVAPTSWFGQSIDVRDVPTPVGRCSYSVRWHGARPALLWEIDTVDPEVAVTVTCPALDPTFRRDVAAGEALLAAPMGAEADVAPTSEPPGPGASFG